MYNRIDSNIQYRYKQQDPQYLGQPLNRSLANGPNQQRRIRDCLFCLLYITFWIAMIVIAIIAFSKGQPHLLAAPFDSAGNQCGYSQNYQNYPFGYYMPTNYSKFVCIDKCPQSNQSVVNCIWNNTIDQNCAKTSVVATIRIVNFCYPRYQKIDQYIDLGLGFFQKAISDMDKSWPIMLMVLFMSLIVSVVFLFFIRMCGGFIIFSVILLYFVVIIGFGVVAFLTAQNKIAINGIQQLNNPDLLRVIAYICWSIAGISLIAFICTVSKIRVAIAIIKTTAQFTRDSCHIILVPILMFIAISIFFTIWVIVSIFIFSSGSVMQCQGSPYACIDWDVGVKRSLGFYLFGLFWNSEVAIGVCQFVIASTCAYWYFSHLNKYQKVSSPLCKSFCRALFYQLGSISLGALILTILWILQLILQFLHYTNKSKTISNDPIANACANYLIKCSRCCLACFQRFIRFISRNAFIMMAISGDGFCTSAHQSFYLILRSGRQYAITNGVGSLIMFFGKLFITLTCTFIGYIMITSIDIFSENIYSPFMPTIIFFVISWVVSSLFMDVFGIGADTLLLCYCIQMDILRGLSYACPEQLKIVMQGYRR